MENNGLLVVTSAKKFNYALVPGDDATSQRPHNRYRCSLPHAKSVMSASNKGSDPELFVEAPLPGPLELLVKELGVKMKPLVEAVKGQKSYSRVECPEGAQVIEKIYRQYNDLIVKVRSISRVLISINVVAGVGSRYPVPQTPRRKRLFSGVLIYSSKRNNCFSTRGRICYRYTNIYSYTWCFRWSSFPYSCHR